MPGIDEKPNQWRVRQTPPNYDHYASKDIGDGVSLIIGFKKGGGSETQSARFDKAHFKTKEQVENWIKNHKGFHVLGEIEDGETTLTTLSESHFFGGSIKLSEECKWYMAAIEHEKDDNGIVLTEKMFNDFIKNFKANVIRCTDDDGKPMLDIDYEHK